MLPITRAITALALLLIAGSATAAGTAADKCTAAKITATAKKAKAKLTCHAKAVKKGVATDPLCLTKAEEKFTLAFSKAETKGGCPTLGDTAAVEAEVDSVVGAILPLLPDGGTDAGRVCAAAKLKATAKRITVDLSCRSRAAGIGVSPDVACLAKGEEGFDAAWVKAETKGGCAASDLEGVEEEALDLERFLVLALQVPVSLAADVQPILTEDCESCHGGVAPAAGMSLEVGASHAALVGVMSVECGAYARVQPGDSASSYLLFKLHGTGPCFVGAQMPPSDPMSSEEVELIAAWVDGGALDN